MKKISLALAISAAAFSLQAMAEPVEYQIDPEHFFIQFKVSHLGYSNIMGTFNDVSGSYTYDSETNEISNVNVTVNTESLDTDHGERNKHLRSGDFLNTDEYGQATFKSTGWSDGELTGELTIHGKTQTVTVPVTKVGEGDDPWGGYRTGFESKMTLDFSDYGIPSELSSKAELYITGEGIKQ